MEYRDTKRARVVGIFFLLAMVASLLGGGLIETILAETDFITAASDEKVTLLAGVLLELVNCISVIGIAVALFPLFRQVDESLALGYVAVRGVEATILTMAALVPLTLLGLSETIGVAGDQTWLPLGQTLITGRGYLTSLLTTTFFSLGAALFYTLLHRGRLLPRFITIWGFVATILIFGWNLLESFGVSVPAGMLLALPIILNEIFLGIWLIVKGFDSRETPSTTKRVTAGEFAH